MDFSNFPSQASATDAFNNIVSPTQDYENPTPDSGVASAMGVFAQMAFKLAKQVVYDAYLRSPFVSPRDRGCELVDYNWICPVREPSDDPLGPIKRLPFFVMAYSFVTSAVRVAACGPSFLPASRSTGFRILEVIIRSAFALCALALLDVCITLPFYMGALIGLTYWIGLWIAAWVAGAVPSNLCFVASVLSRANLLPLTSFYLMETSMMGRVDALSGGGFRVLFPKKFVNELVVTNVLNTPAVAQELGAFVNEMESSGRSSRFLDVLCNNVPSSYTTTVKDPDSDKIQRMTYFDVRDLARDARSRYKAATPAEPVESGDEAMAEAEGRDRLRNQGAGRARKSQRRDRIAAEATWYWPFWTAKTTSQDVIKEASSSTGTSTTEEVVTIPPPVGAGSDVEPAAEVAAGAGRTQGSEVESSDSDPIPLDADDYQVLPRVTGDDGVVRAALTPRAVAECGPAIVRDVMKSPVGVITVVNVTDALSADVESARLVSEGWSQWDAAELGGHASNLLARSRGLRTEGWSLYVRPVVEESPQSVVVDLSAPIEQVVAQMTAIAETVKASSALAEAKKRKVPEGVFVDDVFHPWREASAEAVVIGSSATTKNKPIPVIRTPGWVDGTGLRNVGPNGLNLPTKATPAAVYNVHGGEIVTVGGARLNVRDAILPQSRVTIPLETIIRGDGKVSRQFSSGELATLASQYHVELPGTTLTRGWHFRNELTSCLIFELVNAGNSPRYLMYRSGVDRENLSLDDMLSTLGHVMEQYARDFGRKSALSAFAVPTWLSGIASPMLAIFHTQDLGTVIDYLSKWEVVDRAGVPSSGNRWLIKQLVSYLPAPTSENISYLAGCELCGIPIPMFPAFHTWVRSVGHAVESSIEEVFTQGPSGKVILRREEKAFEFPWKGPSPDSPEFERSFSSHVQPYGPAAGPQAWGRTIHVLVGRANPTQNVILRFVVGRKSQGITAPPQNAWRGGNRPTIRAEGWMTYKPRAEDRPHDVLTDVIATEHFLGVRVSEAGSMATACRRFSHIVDSVGGVGGDTPLSLVHFTPVEFKFLHSLGMWLNGETFSTEEEWRNNSCAAIRLFMSTMVGVDGSDNVSSLTASVVDAQRIERALADVAAEEDEDSVYRVELPGACADGEAEGGLLPEMRAAIEALRKKDYPVEGPAPVLAVRPVAEPRVREQALPPESISERFAEAASRPSAARIMRPARISSRIVYEEEDEQVPYVLPSGGTTVSESSSVLPPRVQGLRVPSARAEAAISTERAQVKNCFIGTASTQFQYRGQVHTSTTQCFFKDGTHIVLAADLPENVGLQDPEITNALTTVMMFVPTDALGLSRKAWQCTLDPARLALSMSTLPVYTLERPVPFVKGMRHADPSTGKIAILQLQEGPSAGIVGDKIEAGIVLSTPWGSQFTFEGETYGYYINTQSGDCGSPVLQGTSMLVGVHIAGGFSMADGSMANVFAPVRLDRKGSSQA